MAVIVLREEMNELQLHTPMKSCRFFPTRSRLSFNQGIMGLRNGSDLESGQRIMTSILSQSFSIKICQYIKKLKEFFSEQMYIHHLDSNFQ